MLSLLFSFEIKSCETTQIFLTDSFIHSGTAANTFSVVMSCVRPPIGLGFDIAQNHVFNCSRKSRNLQIQQQCKLTLYRLKYFPLMLV